MHFQADIQLAIGNYRNDASIGGCRQMLEAFAVDHISTWNISMPSAIQEGSARTASAATQMLAYSATSQNTRPHTCFTSRAETARSLNAVTAVSVTHSCASERVPCSGGIRHV